MAFKRGAESAEKTAEQERKARGGGFDKPQYLTLGDGESAIVRLLHDGDAWYYYQWHGYTPMREPSPEWPEKVRDFYLKKTMSATCQRDENIGGDFCFICDELHTIVPNPKTKNYKRTADRGRYFPRQRYLIPVVIRREVIGTQEMIDSGEIPATIKRGTRDVSTLNRTVGVVDETEEGDLRDPQTGEKTGQRGQIPMIRLIEHPYDTSIAGLTAIWRDAEEGTVLDRDLKVARQGEANDVGTKYLWSARKPTVDHDLSDPETFAIYKPYIPDIEKMITERASDEFYAKFFDPSKPFFAYDADEGGATNGKAERVVKEEVVDEDTANELANVKKNIMASFGAPV